jgi:hypothetical protein
MAYYTRGIKVKYINYSVDSIYQILENGGYIQWTYKYGLINGAATRVDMCNLFDVDNIKLGVITNEKFHLLEKYIKEKGESFEEKEI